MMSESEKMTILGRTRVIAVIVARMKLLHEIGGVRRYGANTPFNRAQGRMLNKARIKHGNSYMNTIDKHARQPHLFIHTFSYLMAA